MASLQIVITVLCLCALTSTFAKWSCKHENCVAEVDNLKEAFEMCKEAAKNITGDGGGSDEGSGSSEGRQHERRKRGHPGRDAINQFLKDHAKELADPVQNLCEIKLKSDKCCKDAEGDGFEVKNPDFMKDTLMCDYGKNCFVLYEYGNSTTDAC